jgi:hypothetical protein
MHPVVIVVYSRSNTQQHSKSSIGGSPHESDWALFGHAFWKDDEHAGNPLGIYKEGNENIPIVVRLRPQDRARLSQIENLYVSSSQESVKVPLLSVATLKDILETAPIEPKLIALKKSLPPGYQLQIGGEKAKQVDGFTNLAVATFITLLLVPVFYSIFVLDLEANSESRESDSIRPHSFDIL